MDSKSDPKGWIKIYRDITTKDIYLQDPLYARVFERLIIEANHACKRIPYKGETKLIKRGEKLTSIRQIAEWVGWYQRGVFRVPNPKTISSILNWLVSNDLIEIYGKNRTKIKCDQIVPKISAKCDQIVNITHRGNSQETHYNVVNYCIYQSIDDGQGNSESNSQVTVKQQSMDTNNNVNNVKNVKKSISSLSSNKFADDAIELILACELYNFILGNNPNVKKPNLQTWAKTIGLMIRRDKRIVDDIRAVMNWCQHDSFWQSNILSPSNLREKYDQLTIKMRSVKRTDKPNKPPSTKFENFYL